MIRYSLLLFMFLVSFLYSCISREAEVENKLSEQELPHANPQPVIEEMKQQQEVTPVPSDPAASNRSKPISLAVTTEELQSIIGSWVSDEDDKSKLVFTSDNKRLDYYDGELLRTQTYLLTKNLKQCDPAFPLEAAEEEDITYLQLADNEGRSVMCYEINTLSGENLSLSVVGRGGITLYNRL
jgi:hypothetical protein